VGEREGERAKVSERSRILLVEDDAELGEELSRRLIREGYEVTWIRDGDEAMRAAPADFDLVLLDLGLPNAYGLDVLKRYRASSEVPVMILTARDHTSDKVRGLSLGADDYVTKPFWPEELLARVRARLRRPVLGRGGAGEARGVEEAAKLRSGAIEIDVQGRRASVGGEDVELTRAELAILELLARRVGRAVTRAEIAEEALDGGGERALDVHVSRLRRKLGVEGARIATVWGIGYRLEGER
jgi:DNA-binding response OmpR family regulator